ncbi:bleomycin resistance protein [Brevibacterium atlanticum]|uniref:bleomycin resistance protein n=1 Tax=Brevibacterium atlanticum TaxID=2697563 RepID=UPI001423A93B|nr:VOC family protein [Brevibacterium atlanticum]
MVKTPHIPSLVPELLISDIGDSVDFWCELCRFEVMYERPGEGFAYIANGSAHIMLEQHGIGRNWIAGDLQRPFGRGMNLQIAVADTHAIAESLNDASYPLFAPPETKWYQVGRGEEAGVRQFLVADPDGYLARFQESIGRRRAHQSATTSEE